MRRRQVKKPVQLTLDSARRPTGRGGWRPGAGRPRGRTRVAHTTRERLAPRFPIHVTLRLREGLGSVRRHAAEGGVRLASRWIDPYSSAAWFDGWRQPIRSDEPWMKELLRAPCPTVPAQVWLLTTGWRRWGLLAFDEVPGGGKRQA